MLALKVPCVLIAAIKSFVVAVALAVMVSVPDENVASVATSVTLIVTSTPLNALPPEVADSTILLLSVPPATAPV